MEIKQASSYNLVDALFLLKQCVLEMNKKGLKQWNSAHPSPQDIKADIDKGTLYICYEMNIAQGMIILSEDVPEEYKEIQFKGKSDKVLYIKRFAIHPLWLDLKWLPNCLTLQKNLQGIIVSLVFVLICWIAIRLMRNFLPAAIF